jgi:DNA polymerase
MNTVNNSNSAILKEMGISEWVSKDAMPLASTEAPLDSSAQSKPRGTWWFFGSKPKGEVEVLFQNLIRVLGLRTDEWLWQEPVNKSKLAKPDNALPIVSIAFGGQAVQAMTGERDTLDELRETILELSIEGLEEIPLIPSFTLEHYISKPQDKRLLWQDLLLAKSVLQSL